MQQLEPIDDVVGPGLRLLIVGINPGRRSAETGCHFAGPGNRFWPALHAAGITPRVLRPHEQDLLVKVGVGITNLASQPTSRATELTAAELRAGVIELRAKVSDWQPRVVAVLGLSAYRIAFSEPSAAVGHQQRPFEGARLWLLPNPSGLNARVPVTEHARGLRAAASMAEIALSGGGGP